MLTCTIPSPIFKDVLPDPLPPLSSPFHHPLHTVQPVPHGTDVGFVPCLCGSFVLTYCLRRSSVAVHRGRVPVHPSASHRGHPHVFRSVSHRQCHRWPEAQRLRRHIHGALR